MGIAPIKVLHYYLHYYTCKTCLVTTGMYGDILVKVEGGYRMSNPGGTGRIVCPNPIYDIMKSCWKHKPEDRPTFEYLKTFFEDYEVSSEEHYLEQ